MLLAGSGSVYGAFIPVYLTGHAWTQAQIGFLLTLNTAASMACQVPAGLIMDLIGPRRRHALAIAVIGMGVAPLLLALAPQWLPALLAMLLLAAATSFLTPAVNAISLAVVDRAGFSERLGRNSRYGSIGAGGGALVMGVCISPACPGRPDRRRHRADRRRGSAAKTTPDGVVGLGLLATVVGYCCALTAEIAEVRHRADAGAGVRLGAMSPS